MSEMTLTQDSRRSGRPLGGWLQKWRVRRDAARAQIAAQNSAARASIEATFSDWLAAADSLREMDDSGWSNPQYARNLTCERAYFRAFQQQLRQLRRTALPA